MIKKIEVGTDLVYILNGNKAIRLLKVIKVNKKTFVVKTTIGNVVKINIQKEAKDNNSLGFFKGSNEFYSGQIYFPYDEAVLIQRKKNEKLKEALEFVEKIKQNLSEISVNKALQMKNALLNANIEI